MVVAIDGPAGAGKSTVARALADALGFTYLDSGAMYGACALPCGRAGRRPRGRPARPDAAGRAGPQPRTFAAAACAGRGRARHDRQDDRPGRPGDHATRPRGRLMALPKVAIVGYPNVGK